MRILFLGAGAIGGYFGGRLAASGADVTFLVRRGRAELLASGLKIESPSELGDVHIKPQLLQSGDVADPFDVIVLTNKAYDLDSALDAIAPYAGPGTIILPILNGLAHIDVIENRMPSNPVLAGSVLCGATVKPDGTIVHLAPPNVMIIGLRQGQEGIREQAKAFHALVDKSGVDAVMHDDVLLALWEKWVFLAALAAVTCTMRGSTGQIAATDFGLGLIEATLDECRSTAIAEGKTPTEKQMDYYIQLMTEPGSKVTASMLRDMESGGLIEADHIIGDMIRRAQSHGIDTPLLKVALTHLQVYEAQRD